MFGTGGGARVAETLSERFGYDVPLLGEVPLDERLRAGGDVGEPLVLTIRRPRLGGARPGWRRSSPTAGRVWSAARWGSRSPGLRLRTPMPVLPTGRRTRPAGVRARWAQVASGVVGRRCRCTGARSSRGRRRASRRRRSRRRAGVLGVGVEPCRHRTGRRRGVGGGVDATGAAGAVDRSVSVDLLLRRLVVDPQVVAQVEVAVEAQVVLVDAVEQVLADEVRGLRSRMSRS